MHQNRNIKKEATTTCFLRVTSRQQQHSDNTRVNITSEVAILGLGYYNIFLLSHERFGLFKT